MASLIKRRKRTTRKVIKFRHQNILKSFPRETAPQGNHPLALLNLIRSTSYSSMVVHGKVTAINSSNSLSSADTCFYARNMLRRKVFDLCRLLAIKAEILKFLLLNVPIFPTNHECQNSFVTAFNTNMIMSHSRDICKV